MKRFVFACATGLWALLPIDRADAAVTAKVSLASQRMEVYVDGTLTHTWPVSTGREDFETPAGSYTTQWLDKDHRSQKYDDAPMPYSVFFRGGYAVHGTTSVGMLGRRASHGCVRLATPNARKFFELVQQHGLGSSKVVIQHGPADRLDKQYVAEIGGKSRRSEETESTPRRRSAGVMRAPIAAYVRGYPQAVYSQAPMPGQPVLVYQIGADGQMIPVGYRRF